MKREFLLNFKVGEQPLPKEIIDEIMAENGRDIQKAKEPFADYDTIKQQLSDAQTTIQGFKDQDIDGVRRSAQEWEEKYNAAIKDHNQKMADMAFDHSLETKIGAMKGRNVKAIKALLDTETLKKSNNQDADITAALEALKKESGYLFDEENVPPPYSGNTGGNPAPPPTATGTLVDALRERFNSK